MSNITEERIKQYIIDSDLYVPTATSFDNITYELRDGRVYVEMFADDSYKGRPHHFVEFCMIDFTVWLVEGRNSEA